MAQLAYEDIKVVIEPGEGDRYLVSVAASPAGETEDPVEVRWNGGRWGVRWARGLTRDIAMPEEDEPEVRLTAEDYGQQLFETFFAGEVELLYRDSKSRMQERGGGLRVKLQITAPELAVLPWELLYDKRTKEFIALSSRTPLVRHMKLATPVTALSVEPPLRILGMIAHPDVPGLAALDVEREKASIEKELADVVAAGHVELHWTDGGRVADLQKKLMERPWHVFHFIGHGEFDKEEEHGFLVVEDDDGGMAKLEADPLATLLRDADVRLAVINACKGATASTRKRVSGTAGTMMQREFGGVVAMQNPIEDEAAITFAKILYTALGQGMPLDTAVAQARMAVKIEHVTADEWWNPVLHLRAKDGRIFDLPEVEKTPLGQALENGLDDYLLSALQRQAWMRRALALWVLLALPMLAWLVGARRPYLTLSAEVQAEGLSYRTFEQRAFMTNLAVVRELSVDDFGSARGPDLMPVPPAPDGSRRLALEPVGNRGITLEFEAFPAVSRVSISRRDGEGPYRLDLQSDAGLTVRATPGGPFRVEEGGRSAEERGFVGGAYEIRSQDRRMSMLADFAEPEDVRFDLARVDSVSLLRWNGDRWESTVVSAVVRLPGHVGSGETLGAREEFAVWGLCRATRESHASTPSAAGDVPADSLARACRITPLRLTPGGVAFELEGSADSLALGTKRVLPPRYIEWLLRERMIYLVLGLVAYAVVPLAGITSMERFSVQLPN